MAEALILIDIQTGFDSPFWGARNNPMAEDNAARLLAHWRGRGGPIFHIRHMSVEVGSPLAPETGGCEFKEQVMPLAGEAVFEKSVNSAFIGTGLETALRRQGITSLVVCGLTTPHCVSTTTRMAANLGFEVTLAHDACAAFVRNGQTGWKDGLAQMSAQDIHDTSISHLHGEFAIARSCAEILAR